MKQGKGALRSAKSVAVIFVLAVATHIVPAIAMDNLNADAVVYNGLARRLAAGEGLVQNVRYVLADRSPVVQPGTNPYPPLYPILITPLVGAFGTIRAAQAANVLLLGISAVLVYLICCRVFDHYTAFVSAAIASVAEANILPAMMALSDMAALCLVLASVFLLVRYHLSWAGVCFSGLAIGLATMCRQPVWLVAVPIAVFVAAQKSIPLARRAAYAVICLLLASLPSLAVGWVQQRSLPHEAVIYQSFQFRVRMDWDAFITGWERPIAPSASAFLSDPGNQRFVISRVAEKFLQGLKVIFAPGSMFALAFSLPVLLWLLARKKLAGPQVLLLSMAALNYVFYSLVWAVPIDQRYYLVTLFLLIPLCVHAIFHVARHARVRGAKWLCFVGYAVLGAAFLLPTHSTIKANSAVWRLHAQGVERNWGFKRPPHAFENQDCESAMRWITENTGKNDVICSNCPFVISYFCNRPSVISGFSTAESCARQAECFNVKYIVVVPSDCSDTCTDVTEWNAHEVLAEAGWQKKASIGPYSIYVQSE